MKKLFVLFFKTARPSFLLAYWALFYLLMPLLSCSKPTGDGSPSSGPRKNVIQGTVYDAQGHPLRIAGGTVAIHIYGNGAIGQTDPAYNLSVDAAGHYEIEVPNNVYAVHARAYLPLNGKKVCVDLKPLDGKPDNISLPSAPGVVRDFALQLTGEIPGGDPSTIQGYYGGKIWLGDGAYNFTSTGYWNHLAAKYPGATVRLTLAPQSALIDGTAGQTLTVSAPVEQVKTGKWFVNIPLAVYSASAVLLLANGTQQALGLSEIPNTGTAYASVPLTFPPDAGDAFGRPGKEQLAVWGN